MRKTKLHLSNKEAISVAISVLKESGFALVNVARIGIHLMSNAQMLVPVLDDASLLKTSLRFNLDVGLRSKGSRSEDIPYSDWLDFVMSFFIDPYAGKFTRFIRRHHHTISICLAVIVPTVTMVVTLLTK